MTVDSFLEHAARMGWEALPPGAGVVDPTVHDRAPADLRLFLDRCGGVRCGGGVRVGNRIVYAQEEVLGEREEADRSAHWYVIAEDSDDSTAERVVIDLHGSRLGRCYEAFWDRFGVAGAMPVVARSFSELLDRLRESDGKPYWSSNPPDLGDAYD
jgi:hypothetical protein